MSQRLELLRLRSLTSYERRARINGYGLVAGVDEAGRGPLAGPVVAAACIVPEGLYIEGINDSKRLTADERAALFEKIRENEEIDCGVGIVDSLIIDQINILQAALQAMMAAIAKLRQEPDFLLIDGPYVPAQKIPGEGIIDGDSLSQSIMAGSIVAKCTRDYLMIHEYDRQWPQYGFRENKGYGTAQHLEALKKHGPCPIHRRSFEPVKSMVAACGA